MLGVGSRVLVTGQGGRSGGVRLTDAAGTNALATVADGVEVEIVAWHPRRGGETRYRVLQASSGVEGWIGAGSLRPRPPVPAPARVVATPSPRLTVSARPQDEDARPTRRSPAAARECPPRKAVATRTRSHKGKR